ncbi:hypothetical protein D7Y13_06000 [Corallococcus praedator]|uniref:Uncharacterized protein n=1 Tax=Corallococcus praedator TaxID=2316724 RepID=A0ABX9QPF2_9BACT|nr:MULTISPECIES: hypothetical protein [Corallococcus]RKH33410.1 hypothetical protein D7X75_12300 [Corallococcus sp. CA031C]RKI14534.1 hypothetical protein D7Y13_06000 [Corallococcus praedator]
MSTIQRGIPNRVETRTPERADAQPVTKPAVRDNAVRAELARDVFQATPGTRSAVSLGAETTVARATSTTAVAPTALTEAEQKSAEQAIANASDGRDASYVSDWLKNNPDPAKQAAFMDLMFKFEGVAGAILDNVQRLPEADRARLSGALDNAYRSGAVTPGELQKAVAAAHSGALPGATHEGLAGIVAGTGNADLIETYAKKEMEIIRADGGYDQQRSAAVATALAGLPPDRLQSFLANNKEGMADVLKNINVDVDASYSPALGKLLDAAGRINPPTAESLKLFSDSIGKLGENRESRAAAARFFTQHGDAVLASMQDKSGSLNLDGQKKMSEFFTRTLFSPPEFEGQDAFRQDVMSRLQSMSTDLEQHATENPPSQDSKRAARLMGGLVGALEGGFQIAVEELNKRNDAVKGMVDLLFSAKSFLPDLPIPGAGKLKDLTIDQLQKWVTSNLQEKAQKPEDAIPFHGAFGEQISNPDLRTDYDAARDTAFVNRQRGLT